MNEDFIKQIWEKKGFSEIGPLERFSEDMKNEDFQRTIWEKKGFNSLGSFEDFQKTLGATPSQESPEVSRLDYAKAVVNEGVLRGQLSSKLSTGIFSNAESYKNISDEDINSLATLFGEMEDNSKILATETGTEDDGYIIETLEQMGSWGSEVAKSLIGSLTNMYENPGQTAAAAAAGGAAGAATSGPISAGLASTGYLLPVAAILSSISAGVGATSTAFAVAGGDVEGSMEGYGRFQKYAQENNLDLKKTEDIKKMFNDQEFMEQTLVAANTKGTVTGTLEAVGGMFMPGVAGKVGAKIANKTGISKTSGYATGTLLGEGLLGGTADVTGSVAGNVRLSEDLNYDELVESFGQEFVVEMFTGGLAQGLGIAADNTVYRKSNNTANKIIEAAMTINPDTYAGEINSLVESGNLDAENGQLLVEKFNEAKTLLSKVPDTEITNKKDRRELVKNLMEREVILNKQSEIDAEISNSATDAITKKLENKKRKLGNLLKFTENKIEFLADASIKEQENIVAPGQDSLPDAVSGASVTEGEGEAPSTFTSKEKADEDYTTIFGDEQVDEQADEDFNTIFGEDPAQTTQESPDQEVGQTTQENTDQEVEQTVEENIDQEVEQTVEENIDQDTEQDTVFNETTDRSTVVGQEVDYGGIKGKVVETENGYGVQDADGDITEIEGGASESTNQDLGLSRVVDQVKASYDPETNTLQARGKSYQLVKVNRDADGNPTSANVIDQDGKKKTFKNKKVLSTLGGPTPAPAPTATPQTEVTQITQEGQPATEVTTEATPEVDPDIEVLNKAEETLDAAAELIDQDILDNTENWGIGDPFTEEFAVTGTARQQEYTGPIGRKTNAGLMSRALTNSSPAVRRKVKKLLGDDLYNEVVDAVKVWKEASKKTTPTIRAKKKANKAIERAAQARMNSLEKLFPGIKANLKKLQGQARAIVNSIPGVVINIIDTPQEFGEIAAKATGKGKASDYLRHRGFLYKGKIYINLAHADATTLPHEAAHVIFKNFFGQSSPDAIALHKIVSKVLSEGTPTEKRLAEQLESFVEGYKERGKYKQSEEFFAELVGWLTANETKISLPRKKRIKQLLNDLLERFTGLRIFNEGHGDFRDVVEFVNTVATGMQKGVDPVQYLLDAGYHPSTSNLNNRAEPDFQNNLETVYPEDYDVIEEAMQLAKDSGINILSGKELSTISRGNNGEIVSALFTEANQTEFSFDVVTKPSRRGQGLGTQMINEAISIYNDLLDVYPDMEYKIDVVNPSMGRLLERSGFEKGPKIAPGRYIYNGTDYVRPTQVTTRHPQEVEQITNSYIDRLSTIKEQNPADYWTVDQPSRDQVRKAVLDGRISEVPGGMGMMTEDGNVVGVFKDDPNFKGVGGSILKDLLDKGANKLDNYDGYLTKVYERSGFKVASRLEFNEAMAPQYWDKSKHGTPDLVFMVYDPNSKLGVKEKSFDKNSYEDASSYRDSYTKVDFQNPKMVNPKLNSIKVDYMSKHETTTKIFPYKDLDEALFQELAEYHKNVQDDRNNSVMEDSYRAFLDETKVQYEYLVDQGYKIEPWLGEGEPYGVSSKAVRDDVINNKHLYYLRSRSATGESSENESADNYMPFEFTGITLNGDEVLFNDLFRAVHDIFGHSMYKNSFSAQGELNAYKTHAPMYSETAQKALFLETVVYNAYYKVNKKYAPRKIYDIPQRFIKPMSEHNNESPDFQETTNGQGFSDFFSNVTKGVRDKSHIEYKPLYDTGMAPVFLEEYVKHVGNFDDHISKSIPGYNDLQVITGNYLSENLTNKDSVLDLGASEGSWVKTVSNLSKAKSIALDTNEDMKAHFNKTPSKYSKYDTRAFLEGFGDVQAFDSDSKFDVIHEGMLFQFISGDRKSQIKEVARLLKDDGIFLTEEKLAPLSEDDMSWSIREAKKDKYKGQYFDQDTLDTKKKDVLGGAKSGMNSLMVDKESLEDTLSKNFDYVARYWNSSNFSGYIASNDFDKVKDFLEDVGPKVVSEYTFDAPEVVKGPEVSLDLGDNPPGSDSEVDFQNEYTHAGSPVKTVYYSDTQEYNRLVEQGVVTTNKTLDDFRGSHMILHVPDNKFSGKHMVGDKVIYTGNGGIYFCLKFLGKFWASQGNAVSGLFDRMVESSKKNGGKVYMALIGAPSNKLISSTNSSVDVFKALMDPDMKISKADLKGALREVYSYMTSKDKKGKTQGSSSVVKLIKENADIATILGPTNSSFNDRKVMAMRFVSAVIRRVSKKKSSQAYKNLSALAGPKLTVSDFSENLYNMLTEPILRNQENTKDRVYAILELDSLEGAKIAKLEDHGSYTHTIEYSPEANFKLHVLKDRQHLTEAGFIHEEHGKLDTENRKKILPSWGMGPKTTLLDPSHEVDFQKPSTQRDKALNNIVNAKEKLFKRFETPDQFFNNFKDSFNKVGITLSDIHHLYAGLDPNKSVQQYAEEAQKTIDNFNEVMDQAGFTPKQKAAEVALYADVAQRWAKQTGRTADEWWSDIIDKFVFAAQDSDIPSGDSVRNQADSVIKSLFDKLKSTLPFTKSRKYSNESNPKKETEPSTPLSQDKDLESTPEGNEYLRKNRNLIRGARQISDNRQAIIYISSSADVSTPVHELAHIYEMYMSNEDKAAFMEAAGKTAWDVDTSERFAIGFERFLSDGRKTSNKKMQPVFDNFRNWLRDIYNGLFKWGGEDIFLSDKMNELYSKMLSSPITNLDKFTKESKKWIKAAEKEGVKYNKETMTEMADVLGFDLVDVRTRGSLRERAARVMQAGLFGTQKVLDLAMNFLAEEASTPGLVGIGELHAMALDFEAGKLQRTALELAEEVRQDPNNIELKQNLEDVQESISIILSALSLANSKAGAVLGAASHRIRNEWFSPDEVTRRAKRENPDVTDKELKDLRRLAKGVEEANRKVEQYKKDYAQAEMDRTVKRINKNFRRFLKIPAIKKVISDLKNSPQPLKDLERDSYKKLRDYYSTQMSSDSRSSANLIQAITLAMLNNPDINSVRDLTNHLIAQVPGINPQEVIEVLNMEYSIGKGAVKTKAAVNNQVQDLKKELNLLDKLRNMIEGDRGSRATTDKTTKSQRLLKEYIKELRQLAAQDTTDHNFGLLYMILDNVERVYDGDLTGLTRGADGKFTDSDIKNLLALVDQYEDTRGKDVQGKKVTLREKIADLDQFMTDLEAMRYGKGTRDSYFDILKRINERNSDQGEVSSIDENEYFKLQSELTRKKALLNERAAEVSRTTAARVMTELANTPRAMILSFDYSFMTYQLGLLTMKNLMSKNFFQQMKLMKMMVTSSLTETMFNNNQANLDNVLNGIYSEATINRWKQLGLNIPERGVAASSTGGISNIEESLRTKTILESAIKWILPERFESLNPIKFMRNFNERGYVTYVSAMRIMEAERMSKGISDTKIQRDIANRVNTFTGASSQFSKDQKLNKGINAFLDQSANVLIAPRLYVSVFKSLWDLGVGTPTAAFKAMLKKDPQMRKFYRKKLMNNLHILVSQGVAFSALSALVGALDGDDEDEINLDFSSAMFLKTQVGDNVVTLSPYATYLRAGTRLGTKAYYENIMGEPYNTRGRNQSQTMVSAVVEEFLKYRMNPIFGSSRLLTKQEDFMGRVVEHDTASEKLVNVVLPSIAPISIQNMAKNIAEERYTEIPGGMLLDMIGINSFRRDATSTPEYVKHTKEVGFKMRISKPKKMVGREEVDILSQTQLNRYKQKVRQGVSERVNAMIKDGKKPSKNFIKRLQRSVEAEVLNELTE